MIEQLVKEFETRVFEESYNRIYKCFQVLEDKDIWSSPNINIPSVGNLVLHLCGNARQWILSGVGNRPDNRKRDEEFIPHQNIKKAELVFLMENLKMNIKEILHEMTEHNLTQHYQVQNFDVTGFSAVIHVLEHFSYHTGQITTLTKLIKNQQLGYYENMNLNQLNNLN